MSNVTPFPAHGQKAGQTGFDRLELQRIMDLYGRMVSAGHWRDYAIDMGRDAAIFSAFRRSAERPEYRIEKRPALRHRQGMWALIGEAGHVLKRGQELHAVLAPVERKLLKIVD
ncbi:DUF2794 domain-containing protein [Sphingobium cloacae]|uniref:DUF2794 domain-containing protein n=1 Tax=Sphingobium cloacae TaxID=120107 RepID=A0A1E1F070_9SPHN|nr:DUF2794 domain-containing protein [Sphingobium cloacae]BAV63884.1 hypothetical protein SCLO_1008440 [Sphingobium cloacae]